MSEGQRSESTDTAGSVEQRFGAVTVRQPRPEQRSDQRTLDLTAHNITRIGDGVPLAADLQALDLTHARIRKLENLEQCTCLEALVMRGNLLSKLEGLESLTVRLFFCSGLRAPIGMC